MERDLQIRGFSPSTQRCYLGRMKEFVRYFMRPPDELTTADINRYQLYLARERKVSWEVFNQSVAALWFFYRITLQKGLEIERIPYQKTGRKLPVVLSQQEVKALLETPTNIKHRAILMATYAGGLRVSEVVNLRVIDIDSQRMTLRIEQGKGRKDRYVMLSAKLLGVLRQYWKTVRPNCWLFPGQIPGRHLTRSAVERIFYKARDGAGITKKVSVHSLRHSFATHLLESGVNIRKIQVLLGHNSLQSTQVYTNIAKDYLDNTPSPLDILPNLGSFSPSKS
ncbi:site-specific integrase [Candidatus Bipolaricaulota bacterium]|nr:site-specific integrase [Candidatus Bipolaricaulota bacterium]